MYSNLSLYYLEHLGIKPWVRRSEGSQKKRLIILLDASLSSKARFLFDKILDFISVSKEDAPLILTQNPDPAFIKRCALFQSLVVLNFRKDQSTTIAEELKGSLHSELSIIDMLSPDDLLIHPAEKKKLFQQLSKIKDAFIS